MAVHFFAARLRFCRTLLLALAASAITALGGAQPRRPSSDLFPPSALRCDGWGNPLAVSTPQPQFSWSLAATAPNLYGVTQSAYQIQVSASSGGFGSTQVPLWDSGVVHSAATFGIQYGGPTLEPQHEYAWRVRVWDKRGSATAWSTVAHWRQAPTWHADWIESPGAASPDAPLPLFRKTFTLTHPVIRAILYASGLGQDELRLNGRKVGNDVLTPGWSDYRKTVFYDSYDVTSLLRPGRNVIGVMLGNGMYRVLHTPGRYTKFVGSMGPPKCIVQLDVEFAGGSSVQIDSDESWKTAPGPITFSSTYGGEDYDARRNPQGWDRAGFNDANWQPAIVTDGPGGALIPELAPPIRVMHIYAPTRITHPAPGMEVFDFGQNFAGWPAIAVTGRAGAVLKLSPGELLDERGLVSQRSSGRPQWFSYTLDGYGTETWHPRFSYYGFRYLEVQGASAQNGVRLLSVQGDAIHSSSPPIGSFLSSDTLLNRIHALILHAIENNAMSIFTDCPHREKLGWLEETHLMAPSILYDFNFAHLYSATARNIADAQKSSGPEAGMVPEIAPQYVVFDPQKYNVFNDSPEWGSAAVLAPWYVYQRTGNLHFLAAQFPVMRRYVAYLATRAHEGIIDYGLGDWCDVGPGPPGCFSKLTSSGVTATAIYCQDLQVMSRTAALLGMSAESEAYKRQAEQVRDAFNARFFHPDRHLYDKGSQTAQAMPLALNIVPESQRRAVLNALIADIRAHQNHTTAGEIGFRYVVDALMNNGRSDVLLDMLSRTDPPSYGNQLAIGATSLTETWDAEPTSSQDHLMLGDAEEWFYHGLGGINVDLARQDASRIVLSPAVLAPMRWVRTHYDSALGPIESDWECGPSHTVYNFMIPANAKATIKLKTADPHAVTVNGVELSNAAGVLSWEISEDAVVIVVSTGQYQIRTANPRQE
ncbi:MAG TPA: family 78 glycoside hydrolase catalytic domain [Terracidiphilus sp.]|nr:family 78 glycoside hydrolase catalytic domain [Terracidiphilus sp.]